MGDPRDTARTWLADQIARYAASYWIPANITLDPEQIEKLAARWGRSGAAAIIDGSNVVAGMPGVTVDLERLLVAESRTAVVDHRNPLANHTQIVLRLPPQSIPDTPPLRDMRYPADRPGWLGRFQPWPCGRCGTEQDDDEPHDCREQPAESNTNPPD